MITKIFQIVFLSAVIAGLDGCVLTKSSSGNAETVNANVSPSENINNSAIINTADGAAKMQGAIRQIDFKNFTYEPSCAGEDAEKITVKKGSYEIDKGDSDRLYFDVQSVVYGDLNGDGDDDAVILTNCNTGGTGQFSEGFIYGMSDGKPKLLARIPGGDRADGGLRSAKVENNLLVIESNDAGEQGGACCPEFVVTTKYKLTGKELKQAGADTKKSLYPEERVKFVKGTTKSVTRIKVDEIKRFVIGAQAGQVLSVSVDSKNITLELTKGEAEVSSADNSLTATLKDNGDYVVQLQNTAEKPTEVTLTIEIE